MRLAPRHPGTLLLALALACLLWYTQALDRRERISERQLDAPLTFVNVPPNLVITSDVPRSVLLRVRGPLSRLRQLEPSQTGVVIDLRGAGEGQRDFAVRDHNVFLPPGVQVLAVSPAQLSVRLERLIERRLPVRPRVIGEPAAGYVLGAVLVDPPTVRVSGPRLQVDALQAVVTDPVSVDGADATVKAMVAIRLPEPLIHAEGPPLVKVTVNLIAQQGTLEERSLR